MHIEEKRKRAYVGGCHVMASYVLPPFQHQTALQSRLRSLFAEYAGKNGMDHKGTTSHASTAWTTFMTHIQPLFTSGMLSRDVIQQIRDVCDAPRVDVTMSESDKMQQEMTKNGALQKQMGEMQAKQVTTISCVHMCVGVCVGVGCVGVCVCVYVCA